LRCPAVELTCWSAKSWSRRDRHALTALAARWGDRFSFAAGGTLQDQLTLMHEHDWFVYPATRCDFGIHPVRALHCGLPVVCWDVPPLSERIRPGVNGVLVPCERSANWANAPTADAVATRFVDACAPVLSDVRALCGLQAADWGLRPAAVAFQRFWLGLFGVG
jgi:glycosyltransferase involved in cell wall biosynthesis